MTTYDVSDLTAAQLAQFTTLLGNFRIENRSGPAADSLGTFRCIGSVLYVKISNDQWVALREGRQTDPVVCSNDAMRHTPQEFAPRIFKDIDGDMWHEVEPDRFIIGRSRAVAMKQFATAPHSGCTLDRLWSAFPPSPLLSHEA